MLQYYYVMRKVAVYYISSAILQQLCILTILDRPNGIMYFNVNTLRFVSLRERDLTPFSHSTLPFQVNAETPNQNIVKGIDG